jgi:hypothetical protein
MRALLVILFGFCAAFVVTGVVFMASGVFGPAHNAGPAGQLLANFLMGCHFVAISAVLNTIAFGVLVAVSASWRRLNPWGAALLGIAGFVISISGLQYHILQLVPWFPIMGVLTTLLPGGLMGLLAVLTVSLAPGRTGMSPIRQCASSGEGP